MKVPARSVPAHTRCTTALSGLLSLRAMAAWIRKPAVANAGAVLWCGPPKSAGHRARPTPVASARSRSRPARRRLRSSPSGRSAGQASCSDVWMAASPATPSPGGAGAGTPAACAGAGETVAEEVATFSGGRPPENGAVGTAERGGAEMAGVLGLSGTVSRAVPATARAAVASSSRRGERAEGVVIAAGPLPRIPAWR
ncbi:hypothetical protein Saso_74380 [Streptomyces asoensis]|uniref:Uncharacterized protein n=1 Tax=Streptomyces asoensis TaxID=249586 RepID=A0ABQ3SCD1_9ACTN|nr:hypothetical protein GCM10010496_73720 [Streptomyces asoensis]GHI65788.1 hypothetical protein Saso_74380 [Streptomyces asoensis]